MRVVVTGQVGLDKKPFLRRVADILRAGGREIAVHNIGEMMYAEAPDVAPGRILDLPLSRLQSLRRSVFKDVLVACEANSGAADVLVNTHATFRWRHGLFYAFDCDHMKALAADLYIVLVDNIDRMHYRLVRDGHVDHTLKDLMVWREEEILATELVSQIVGGHRCFYICTRGDDDDDVPAGMLARLLSSPGGLKAYLSYPMSHVHHDESGVALLSEIEAFRRQMRRLFVCFDPGDLEEKHLAVEAIKAAEQGRRTVAAGPPSKRVTMETGQLVDIIADIDGQIYARDFKLIDQSDMIISLIPKLPSGRPGLSSGVERELQHAHEATRDVFVIWCADAAPSPFVTETATRVFRCLDEAVEFFLTSGYIPAPPMGGLFT